MLAIVSDFHGNLTALDAVIADLEQREVRNVIHGGDLALGGAQAAEVIDRIRELGWPGVIGNVDQLLYAHAERERQLQRAPKLGPLLRLLFDDYAPVTRELIGPNRVKWLRSLPAEHRAHGLVVLHASPGDLWRAPLPEDTDATIADTYASCRAPRVVYGHIHRPYIRELDGLTVANAGSVGSPFDGDPRASYILVEGDDITIVRVDYDLEREMALLLRSGYPDASRIAQMRRRGQFVALDSPRPAGDH